VRCNFGIIEGDQGVIPFKYLVLVAISAISDAHITCLMIDYLLTLQLLFSDRHGHADSLMGRYIVL